MKTKTLSQKVREKIEGSLETVTSRVVDALVEDEISNRVKKVVSYVEKAEKAEKEIKSIRADQKAYDEKGQLISENWSKQQLDKLNKAKQLHKKIVESLDLALEKNDYSRLQEDKEQG